MRGFYKMEFTGKQGQGAGAIAFVDGKIAGLDAGGGVYNGEFQIGPDGTATGYVDMSLPLGGLLVTGAVFTPGSQPIRIPFEIKADKSHGEVLRIDTPTGPINLRLTRVSAL
jgi:hypothetical protein